MAGIRIFTVPTCEHCRDAKAWLRERGCDFEELDITDDVAALREWRELSGGAGVPVIAHGKDFMVGFEPDRLGRLVSCRDRSTDVDLSPPDGGA